MNLSHAMTVICQMNSLKWLNVFQLFIGDAQVQSWSKFRKDSAKQQAESNF
jgi:hypothetical protein